MISGAEYQSLSYGIFPNAAHDKNVPCARCYTQRSATVMIPSRRSCPSGWTKEYEGKYNKGFYQYSLLALKECYHWVVGRLTCWLAAGRLLIFIKGSFYHGHMYNASVVSHYIALNVELNLFQ